MSDSRPGNLTVRPMCAKLLRDTEVFGSMDPYCIVTLGGSKQRTRVASSAGKFPQWQDQFVFRRSSEEQIFFQVWDKDTMSSDDLVGEGSTLLRDVFRSAGVWEGWIDLVYKGKKAGSVRCQMSWAPEQSGAPQQRTMTHQTMPPPNYSNAIPQNRYPAMPQYPQGTMPPPPGYHQPGTMPPPPGYHQPGTMPPPPNYGQQGTMPPPPGYHQPGTMPPPPNYGQQPPPGYAQQRPAGQQGTMPPPGYPPSAPPPGYPQQGTMPNYAPPPPGYGPPPQYGQPYQMPGQFFNPYGQQPPPPPPQGYAPSAPPPP